VVLTTIAGIVSCDTSESKTIMLVACLFAVDPLAPPLYAGNRVQFTEYNT